MKTKVVVERDPQKARRLWLAILSIAILLACAGLYSNKKVLLKGARPGVFSSGRQRQAGPSPENCTAADLKVPQREICGHETRATIEVPEPAPLLLMGTGLLSMAGLLRKRINRSIRPKAPAVR